MACGRCFPTTAPASRCCALCVYHLVPEKSCRSWPRSLLWSRAPSADTKPCLSRPSPLGRAMSWSPPGSRHLAKPTPQWWSCPWPSCSGAPLPPRWCPAVTSSTSTPAPRCRVSGPWPNARPWVCPHDLNWRRRPRPLGAWCSRNRIWMCCGAPMTGVTFVCPARGFWPLDVRGCCPMPLTHGCFGTATCVWRHRPRQRPKACCPRPYRPALTKTCATALTDFSLCVRCA